MAEHLQSQKIKVSGHLIDKRGIWHMKLSWVTPSGSRERKSISTGLPVKGNKTSALDMLSEAKKKQKALLKDMPHEQNLLFADFMEQWLEVIRNDKNKPLRPTTFGGYQENVQKNIAPYFRKKGILLQKLTADDINDFYDDRLKHLKATSVIKFHANISRALKYAVKQGYIPYSIMDKVDRPKPERYVGKFLKQSEVVRLFDVVSGHKLELGVILGAFYGLRRSEVLGLRWEAIDFEANTITIEHTITTAVVDGKKIVIAADTTKSKASFRTLPLVPSIRTKLLEMQAEQERNRKLCGNSYNKADSCYIYTETLGGRIKPNYLTHSFPKFMEKNGFRRMRFHDLRHSCASLLLANGVSLKQIQEWLGHSDFAITANTYAHLDFSSKLASAQAMTWIENTSLAQENQDDANPCGASDTAASGNQMATISSKTA